MPTTVIVKCAHCNSPFTARTADRARGWAKFCSKSCKAIEQENRTGQHQKFRNRNLTESRNSGGFSPSMESGYLGHGQE